MEVCLNEKVQLSLRSQSVITENEVAYQVGDLYIAVNVLTGNRRKISIDNSINESKRVLKG